MKIELSIILPAYNEEKNIERCINRIQEYLNDKYNYEIIIVDDGSKDKTIQKINSIKKNNNIQFIQVKENKGKGYAIKKGVEKAEKDLILFMDVDLATDISEIDKFIKEIQDADIVIGTRKIKESEILRYQPLYRIILGDIFRRSVRFFYKIKASDITCGFKLFKSAAATKIFSGLIANRWAFDVEILYKAYLNNYKVKELPVIWKDSGSTRVKIILDIIRTLIELIKIKLFVR